jgi:hypothetical protein
MNDHKPVLITQLSPEEMLEVIANRQVKINWEEDYLVKGKTRVHVISVSAFPGDTGGNWHYSSVNEDTPANRRKALHEALLSIRNSPDGLRPEPEDE